MQQGFSIPLSATGRSSLAPTPPWHYVSDFVTVEFWADPAATQALLPPGLTVRAQDPGRCFLHFTDNQYTSDALNEHTDPTVSQYLECFVVVEALWRGREIGFVPYILVDNDNALIRGWAQGMPKQYGVVRMSRPFALDSAAAPKVGPAGTFYASLTHRNRRLIDASVRLEREVAALPLPKETLNYRHFPSLEKRDGYRPVIYDLVGQKRKDIRFSPIWEGSAELAIEASPWHEMSDLRPLRVGRGFRYTRAMTVDDLEVLESLQANPSTT